MSKYPDARITGCTMAIFANDPAQFSAIVNVLVSCEHSHIFVVDKDSRQVYLSETAVKCIEQTVTFHPTTETKCPAWVVSLIDAVVHNTPIDFGGQAVPLSVQRELSRALPPAPAENANA